MRNLFLLVICLAFSYPSFAQNENERRWLIVFTAEEHHQELSAQRDLIISNREDFLERRVAMMWVNNKNQVKPIFNSPTSGGNFTRNFQRFNTPKSDFQVILIGLDGGVKFRSEMHIPYNELIRVIDEMPMRQRELVNATEEIDDPQ